MAAQKKSLYRDSDSVAELINPTGSASVVFVCEHASNYIPEHLNGLQTSPETQSSHAAWDIGALGVARFMSKQLNAQLVISKISRLVIDCNRSTDAPDSIPSRVEVHTIPGNVALTQTERNERIERFYKPFHALLVKTLNCNGTIKAIIPIHSFTPVFNGIDRNVDLGLLFDGNRMLADRVFRLARAHTTFNTAYNEPYKPEARYTNTVRMHAIPRNIPHLMFEIRNSLIQTEQEQKEVGNVLSTLVAEALEIPVNPISESSSP